MRKFVLTPQERRLKKSARKLRVIIFNPLSFMNRIHWNDEQIEEELNHRKSTFTLKKGK